MIPASFANGKGLKSTQGIVPTIDGFAITQRWRLHRPHQSREIKMLEVPTWTGILTIEIMKKKVVVVNIHKASSVTIQVVWLWLLAVCTDICWNLQTAFARQSLLESKDPHCPEADTTKLQSSIPLGARVFFLSPFFFFLQQPELFRSVFVDQRWIINGYSYIFHIYIQSKEV